MFKRKLVILLLTLLSVSVSAQQEPSFSHYWAMEPSFNPAAAGKESKINVTGAFAMTLTGFEHAPRTMYVGADMPLLFMNAYHGVGVQLMNDQIGLFNHQRLALQYAYKHKMFGGMLSVGLQLGLLSEKFKGSELVPVPPYRKSGFVGRTAQQEKMQIKINCPSAKKCGCRYASVCYAYLAAGKCTDKLVVETIGKTFFKDKYIKQR